MTTAATTLPKIIDNEDLYRIPDIKARKKRETKTRRAAKSTALDVSMHML